MMSGTEYIIYHGSCSASILSQWEEGLEVKAKFKTKFNRRVSSTG